MPDAVLRPVIRKLCRQRLREIERGECPVLQIQKIKGQDNREGGGWFPCSPRGPRSLRDSVRGLVGWVDPVSVLGACSVPGSTVRSSGWKEALP